MWWLTQDRRVPEFDPGLHLGFAFLFHDQLRSGDLLGPFNAWTQYPPLVHMVGAIATFIAGKDVWPGVMAENLIFVPMLSLGCYGTARLVYRSELAGLLAVMFALGTPMIIGIFHEFMLDGPETALAAVAVWSLLASNSFERVGVSAAAGAAVGFGLLSKESFVTFVAGVAVIAAAKAIRRRNWRGLLVFAAVAAVLAAPWYIRHYGQVRDLERITSGPGTSNAPGSSSPLRYSAKNAGWYFWSDVNFQTLAPLLAFAFAGTVLAVVQLFRRPWRYPLTLELLAGGLVSWLGVSYSIPHDPRYSLPALVYLSVLGTGWVTVLPRPRLRIAAIALLTWIVFWNSVGASTSLGHRLYITLPGAPKGSPLAERQFTLYSDRGYTLGKPQRSGDVLGLMRSLHHRGIRYIVWDFNAATTATFNNEGLSAFAQMAGLAVANSPRKPPTDMVFLAHGPPLAGKPPCATLYDGSAVYAQIPLKQPRDICPR